MPFPATPTVGQTYVDAQGQVFEWTGSAWRKAPAALSGASVMTNNGDGTIEHNDGNGNAVTIDIPAETVAHINDAEERALSDGMHGAVVPASGPEINAMDGDETTIVKLDNGATRLMTLTDFVDRGGVPQRLSVLNLRGNTPAAGQPAYYLDDLVTPNVMMFWEGSKYVPVQDRSFMRIRRGALTIPGNLETPVTGMVVDSSSTSAHFTMTGGQYITCTGDFNTSAVLLSAQCNFSGPVNDTYYVAIQKYTAATNSVTYAAQQWHRRELPTPDIGAAFGTLGVTTVVRAAAGDGFRVVAFQSKVGAQRNIVVGANLTATAIMSF